MPRNCLVINLDRCTGCDSCIVSCKLEHGLPLGTYFNRVIQVGPTGTYPNIERYNLPVQCQQCTHARCIEVCPTGAIQLITKADKSATQIGHAVWIKENCVVNTDEVNCGNCERHCPTKAIQMVAKDPNDPKSLKVPVIDTELCIGCGACEYYCPSRPLSAIYVEGHERHRTV